MPHDIPEEPHPLRLHYNTSVERVVIPKDAAHNDYEAVLVPSLKDTTSASATHENVKFQLAAITNGANSRLRDDTVGLAVKGSLLWDICH